MNTRHTWTLAFLFACLASACAPTFAEQRLTALHQQHDTHHVTLQGKIAAWQVTRTQLDADTRALHAALTPKQQTLLTSALALHTDAADQAFIVSLPAAQEAAWQALIVRHQAGEVQQAALVQELATLQAEAQQVSAQQGYVQQAQANKTAALFAMGQYFQQQQAVQQQNAQQAAQSHQQAMDSMNQQQLNYQLQQLNNNLRRIR